MPHFTQLLSRSRRINTISLLKCCCPIPNYENRRNGKFEAINKDKSCVSAVEQSTSNPIFQKDKQDAVDCINWSKIIEMISEDEALEENKAEEGEMADLSDAECDYECDSDHTDTKEKDIKVSKREDSTMDFESKRVVWDLDDDTDEINGFSDTDGQ